MTEQKELLPEMMPQQIVALICRCNALRVSFNICPHCGAEWDKRQASAIYSRTQPAEDERQKLLEILVGELANAIAQGYRPNLIDMVEAHRILKLPVQPAASTPTEPCRLGEPLMHGPQTYRWCATHNQLMLTCNAVAAASTEARDERKTDDA